MLTKLNLITLCFMLITACASIRAQTGEVRGKVVDEKGQGLFGVTVSVLDSKGNNINKFTHTDSSGNYGLHGLNEHQNNLKFYKDGYVTNIINKIPSRADTVIIKNVELEKRTPHGDGILKDVRYSLAQSGEISGKITTGKNQPLQGAIVAVSDSIGHERHHFTKSNDDGTYTLNHLFPGNYYIKYSGEGFQPKIINVSVKPDTFTIENIRMKRSKKNSHPYP